MSITLLGIHHDRAAFVCSDEPVLETYVRDDRRALRDHEGATRVYVLAYDAQPSQIIGYFTLATSSFDFADLPKNIQRMYPPYPGAIILGRMAVDSRHRGKDFGTTLIHEAFRLSLETRQLVGFIAMIVDAKNDGLVTYYTNHNFQLFAGKLRLFIRAETMQALLDEAREKLHRSTESA